MGVTLVVNPGSTSKKYALYEGEVQLYAASYEHTGDGFGVCRERNHEQQICEAIEAQSFTKALSLFLAEAVAADIIKKFEDVAAVGIRIVAPGDLFTKHTRISPAYLNALNELTEVAPLHIPVMVEEISVIQSLLKDTPLYGISDSAFHMSLPMYRRRFGISRNDADTYEIKRYGYHGLSMASLTRKMESFFGVIPDRVVAVHVGGGISATALHYQESVDTSMGYSPASGIVMGCRAGSFGADALIALMAKKGMRSISTLTNYINRDAGFFALTGYADLRLVLKQYTEGDSNAAEAMQMMRYQLHREIGGHIALLGGIDAFVFTGTAVVRNPFLRAFLLGDLNGLGIEIDTERNDTLVGREGMIHTDRSDVSVGVMKNDEMGEIARALQTLHVS